MTTETKHTPERAAFSVAVVESTVLGIVAHRARCLNCGWESRGFGGKTGEVRALALAKIHGAMHADGSIAKAEGKV